MTGREAHVLGGPWRPRPDLGVPPPLSEATCGRCGEPLTVLREATGLTLCRTCSGAGDAAHIAVEAALLASAAAGMIAGVAFAFGGQLAGVLSTLAGAWPR